MDSLSKIKKDISLCKKCRLFRTARKGVSGEGPKNAKIFLIGQAPGAQEDKTGKPFVGKAGKYLMQILNENGIRHVFITSTVKHYPPRNRQPRKDEISACKPYLLRQLALVKPKIVVLLGKTAQNIKKELKCKHVITTVHPAAAMRFPAMNKRIRRDFRRLKRLL